MKSIAPSSLYHKQVLSTGISTGDGRGDTVPIRLFRGMMND